MIEVPFYPDTHVRQARSGVLNPPPDLPAVGLVFLPKQAEQGCFFVADLESCDVPDKRSNAQQVDRVSQVHGPAKQHHDKAKIHGIAAEPVGARGG